MFEHFAFLIFFYSALCSLLGVRSQSGLRSVSEWGRFCRWVYFIHGYRMLQVNSQLQRSSDCVKSIVSLFGMRCSVWSESRDERNYHFCVVVFVSPVNLVHSRITMQ